MSKPMGTWQKMAKDAVPERGGLTVWLPGDLPMYFRLIRRSACFIKPFLMGSTGYGEDETPVHRVDVTEDFCLGTFPVTQQQYAAVVPFLPKRSDDRRPDEVRCRPSCTSPYMTRKGGSTAFRPATPLHDDSHPVNSVTWHEAQAFCQWVGKHGRCERTFAPLFGSLPYEAYWEYACRAGTTTEYYTGDGKEALKRAGWYGERELGGGSTHPVGSLLPNEFGLFDMHGNVYEWCLDTVRPDRKYGYRYRRDGITASEAYWMAQRNEDTVYGSRILRGGSFLEGPGLCRSASRECWYADQRTSGIGFRVCLSRKPLSEE